MGRTANHGGRVQVVLKLPKYQVPLLVSQARGIVQRMTGNSWFPSPEPPLADVQAAVDGLAVAEAATVTRTAGSVEVRNDKRRGLVVLLDYLRAHVELVANANKEHARAIAESAGMYLKEKGGPSVPVFHAKPGRVSTEVDLVAPSAGDRASYEFQYSLDGGKTWLGLPEPFTTKATVTVTGLTPGATVHFRHRASVKGVLGDWSDVVAIIVD
jgi:hypothetical protein